jgi:hypothetical protein
MFTPVTKVNSAAIHAVADMQLLEIVEETVYEQARQAAKVKADAANKGYNGFVTSPDPFGGTKTEWKGDAAAYYNSCTAPLNKISFDRGAK